MLSLLLGILSEAFYGACIYATEKRTTEFQIASLQHPKAIYLGFSRD